MVKVWHARETEVEFSLASAVTISTSAAIDTFFTGSSMAGNMKNVTIVVPEGAIEKIDLLGETSNFQNAELEMKPYGLATISGTLVLPGDEVLETFFMGPSGTVVTGGFTRYQAGSSATSSKRPQIAILVNLTDGTDEVSIVLDDAYITKLGDKKISGADGHWEMDFEAVCLPSDYYEEFKD